jgi:FkbM family methyltransferase
MYNYLKTILANYLRGAARRLDGPSQPLPANGHARTDPFFDCLVQLGFSPKTIVDIGAHRGDWSRTAMNYFPNAQYLLFEPQGELLENFNPEKNSQIKIFPYGVGRKTGVMKFSKSSRLDSCSFALSSDAASKLGREQVDVSVVAFDDFVEREALDFPEMLKIDAEGWDLEVLEGANKALSIAEVVLVEAAVMCKSFANKIDVVMAEMKKHGFVLFDITDLNRTAKHNALWLVEVAFVRKGGGLDTSVSAYE